MDDSDEATAATVRRLLLRWADAVATGDLDGIGADRAPDVVMFDVPPPEQGVRGIEAYREVWPAFVAWQSRPGVVFEIDTLEVTAGEDVAFAWALLRCGDADERAQHPDRRLRLTVGLRRAAGGWVVTHEHHSFTHPA